VKKIAGKAGAAFRTVSAELLGAAVRAQGDGVVIVALGAQPDALEIVFANDTFCTMTGRPLEELAAMPPWKLHVDPDLFEKIPRWLRTSEPGRFLSGEGFLLRKDGSTFPAAWSISALFDPHGLPTHLVATYRDNTERRRLQEALVHSQRLEATGRLAGGVAHDFNNLLSVINGYCEMLVREVSDRPNALRQVNEAHQATQRAMNLTRDLLAFGRRQPSDPQVLNLNRLVQENASILTRLIGSAGLLELELAADLGHVRADPTQLQQVLLNLVLNARDALRDRGRITIATTNREVEASTSVHGADIPAGRYVCLQVIDNGTGMDAETQRHLFEPFFTTKPEGKGTGLGLALVYGVVQQNAGFINVRSVVLAGSTFEVFFPEVSAPATESPTSAPAPMPETRGHETLLLVEEDEVVCKMVAGMLTVDGYRVTAAKNPEQVLGMKRDDTRPVQLLIVGADAAGEALARELHRRSARLRVLRVGQVERPGPMAWLPANQQAAIAKPFALSELLRSVRALLDA
jgi:PAS domain S-box-containing protein